MLAPIMAQISEDTSIPVREVDVDYNVEEVAEREIVGVPTTILVDDHGMEIVRVVGAKPYPEMMSALSLG